MLDSYSEVMNQVAWNFKMHGVKIALDLMTLHPAIAIPRAIFAICDAVLGWSHSATVRATLLCQSDIADAVILYVRRYYSTDDEPNLTRCLISLVSSHLVGEGIYLQLYKNNAIAISNVDNVKATANRLHLFAP